MYYYEVIECGRKILLIDVLILIAPGTVTQTTVGCVLALINLLVFELLRPHVDTADAWLYRLVSLEAIYVLFILSRLVSWYPCVFENFVRRWSIGCVKRRCEITRMVYLERCTTLSACVSDKSENVSYQ